MMKIELRWKLMLVFCAAVMACLLVGYSYLNAHLKTFLDEDIRKNLKEKVLLAGDLVEVSRIAGGPSTDLQVLARDISGRTGVRVTIVSLDGVVRGDSELDDEGLKQVENHAGRPEIKDALGKGFGVSRRYSYTIKKYLLYVAVPFGQPQVEGVIRLAMPLAAVELLENKSRQIVLFALGLAFLFSLGFAYFISVMISRPLKEMALVAKALAGGDFSRKPSVRTQDEVGDLARAITHMSDQIREKINAVEQEKAKLDAVIMHMFEGIMVVDAGGVVRLMNPSLCKMFLIDALPEGRKAVELVRNSILAAALEELLSGKGRSISREIEVTFPDERVFKLNGVVIRFSNKPDGAVLVFHDITELRHLEKVRQDFVANVSHELRTPVASIKGYAETLLGGAMDDRAALTEFLGIIQQDSDRLVNLINDLLDLARIESGRMKMTPGPLDLVPLVKRCLAILEKTAQAKRLVISLDLPVDLPKVQADEARLSQVFLNLLDNAIKYTSDAGSVNIKIRRQEEFVLVEVVDTGIGIAEEDLPRIFERFYRVDKARSRDMGGTGLGLSIVKHIVLAHGGAVWAHSRLGQGTTFSFTIPLA